MLPAPWRTSEEHHLIPPSCARPSSGAPDEAREQSPSCRHALLMCPIAQLCSLSYAQSGSIDFDAATRDRSVRISCWTPHLASLLLLVQQSAAGTGAWDVSAELSTEAKRAEKQELDDAVAALHELIDPSALTVVVRSQRSPRDAHFAGQLASKLQLQGVPTSQIHQVIEIHGPRVLTHIFAAAITSCTKRSC